MDAYHSFLKDHFQGIELKKPLFYRWPIGLRFDLQTRATDEAGYFEAVVERAQHLFDAIFQPEDSIFMVVNEWRENEQPLTTAHYAFQQVKDVREAALSHQLLRQPYEADDPEDVWNQAIVGVRIRQLDVSNLLLALAHTDFGDRSPRMHAGTWPTSTEVYFLHREKKLIFNMYDDRGLDIIATELDTLRPIYEQYQEWILDHDKPLIMERFEKD
jgi:hypothetical protein